MPAKLTTIKIILLIFGSLVAVLVMVALAVLIFFDANAYKPRVEAQLSEATGMSVSVEGKLAVTIFPRLQLTLADVRIINQGTELAFLKEADIVIELLPLLQREIRYGNISVSGARISILRDRDGRYNYQRPQGANQAFRGLKLPRVSFADLVVAYADKQSGSAFESSMCNGSLEDMRHPGDAPLLSRLSLQGQFACAEVRGKNQAITDLKFSVAADEGVFGFKPVTMRAFGGIGSGTMRIDRSAEIPTYEMSYTLSKFRIEEFFKAQSSGISVRGLMDFSTTLAMQGRNRLAMRQSTQGNMSLSGSNLALSGLDLDAQLAKFESSQNLNLFDVGALLFAGPVGLAVTKGYEYTDLGTKSKGNTQIPSVVSKWKVEKGIAQATDVALATNANRLAVHGGLDFVTNQYRDISVALLDANGCAKARQKISGAFTKPIIDKSSFLVPVGPLLRLLEKAKTFIAGPAVTCEVFYNGSVAAVK